MCPPPSSPPRLLVHSNHENLIKAPLKIQKILISCNPCVRTRKVTLEIGLESKILIYRRREMALAPWELNPKTNNRYRECSHEVEAAKEREKMGNETLTGVGKGKKKETVPIAL